MTAGAERPSGRLEVAVGWRSERGPRERNEDYAGAWLGTPAQRARHGVVAAVADGVGGAKGGRVAAELAVRSFIDGYLARPETQGVRQAAARLTAALNDWLHAQGRADRSLEGMACTFTALVLRGRQAHAVHVGDSRLYRLREGGLSQLTTDHVPPGSKGTGALSRALGMGDGLRADYALEDLREHDRFLLCSDGVHGALPARRLAAILTPRADPEETAGELVAAALAARVGDNATALVVDVLALPEATQAELEEGAGALPIGPVPRAGETVDGYELGRVLADGRYSRVLRARDLAAAGPPGREVVLKFPKPSVTNDATFRLAFVRETWVAGRVRSPWVGEVLEPSPPGRRTRLYTAMPFYGGETLEQRLLRAPRLGVTEGLGIAIRLARAVAALHRAGVIHRDIKPDNVVLERSGGGDGLKLVDLGVARLPHLEDFPSADVPGTPSYMAPELFDGAAGDERSDLYALGVTLYRAFAGGAYPYGEVEPFARPRFGAATPLARHRPDLPAWLDRALARATSAAPEQRPADALELAQELEHGLARGAPLKAGRRPLYERDPLLAWKLVSAVLALLLLASLTLR